MGYIYVIADDEEKMCKIGMSLNPRQRFRAFQPCSPVKLKLVFSSQVADMKLAEELVHLRLQNMRDHGEWFKVSPATAIGVVAQTVSDLNRNRALDLSERRKTQSIEFINEILKPENSSLLS